MGIDSGDEDIPRPLNDIADSSEDQEIMWKEDESGSSKRDEGEIELEQGSWPQLVNLAWIN